MYMFFLLAAFDSVIICCAIGSIAIEIERIRKILEKHK